MCGFCNVWLCVCVGFVMCWCFGNMCTCICYVLYCVFVLFRLCIFIFIRFFCISERTTATHYTFAVNNNNNNNNKHRAHLLHRVKYTLMRSH